MDKKTRDLWIAALRSGEHAQGKSFLKREDCYCCLGVLCQITNPPGWNPETGSITHMDESAEEGEQPETYEDDQELPKTTREHFGMLDRDLVTLIAMNDYDHKSFNEIADWIEEYI